MAELKMIERGTLYVTADDVAAAGEQLDRMTALLDSLAAAVFARHHSDIYARIKAAAEKIEGRQLEDWELLTHAASYEMEVRTAELQPVHVVTWKGDSILNYTPPYLGTDANGSMKYFWKIGEIKT